MEVGIAMKVGNGGDRDRDREIDGEAGIVVVG